MKKWLLFLLSASEATIVLVAVYFEPSYGVRGALWREATFDGRPTSYWRDELDRWNVERFTMRRGSLEWCGSQQRRIVLYSRESTWFERQRERWLPAPAKSEGNPNGVIEILYGGPRILDSKDAAAPVLEALLDDPSPRVRLMARIGLGLEHDIPDGGDW